MSNVTSRRHAAMLDGLKDGDSNYFNWVQEALGDIRLVSWDWGALDFHWTIDGRGVMPDGVMFGGHIAAVADFVTSAAAMSALSDNDDRFRTVRLETNYHRPIKAPHATIEARVVNISKSLIHVDAEIFNAEEKIAVRVHALEVRRRSSDPRHP